MAVFQHSFMYRTGDWSDLDHRLQFADSWSRQMVLCWGQSFPTGFSGQCLETFLVITTGRDWCHFLASMGIEIRDAIKHCTKHRAAKNYPDQNVSSVKLEKCLSREKKLILCVYQSNSPLNSTSCLISGA